MENKKPISISKEGMEKYTSPAADAVLYLNKLLLALTVLAIIVVLVVTIILVATTLNVFYWLITTSIPIIYSVDVINSNILKTIELRFREKNYLMEKLINKDVE